MAVTIRAATEDDASSIVAAHIDGWQWAYRGLMPDDFLASLTITAPRREAVRRERLGQTAGEQRTWVAELDGRVVGFADTGPAHIAHGADPSPHTGEIFLIYLVEDAAGRGIGRTLMDHAVDGLRGQGFRRAILWVLEANSRARRFYEAAGFHPDGAAKTDAYSGVDLKALRYARELT